MDSLRPPGKTLADLSHNIVWGNSLADGRASPTRSTGRAFRRLRPAGRGFDCVIGNPPWERLKLQEREFFAFSAPDIANAVSAAERRQLIAELEQETRNCSPPTGGQGRGRPHARLRRASGTIPADGAGDINTYMLFAELARKLVAPRGRVGLLVPSGIATDHTTKDFFNELMDPSR